MQKKRNFFGNKSITFSALALVIFGSLMIASAEMGNSVGDTDYLTGVIVKQVIYALTGIAAYFICMHFKIYKKNIAIFNFLYIILAAALLACRGFSAVNGAYAWIRLPGGITIQPSEFAKAFMIVYGAKLVGKDCGEKNIDNIKRYGICAGIYLGIIYFVQNDFGSAVVLAMICYVICLIPNHSELRDIQKYMIIIIFVGIAGLAFLLSPIATNWMMKHNDNYMIGRFLAAANPFLYRYDSGYHVIMALVSFANGGVFGLGYGNSIHKYMNFPNPSNDFILPVIVEELGIVGFCGFILAYCFLLVPIVRASFKSKLMSSKMVFLGVFTYFIVHFILNVGGVSAIIPLTGVPLLLISSGGSSLVASMCALGFAQGEIIRNRMDTNEDNSGEI